MRLVVQEDENGCGVACVAMLAGTTYHQARRVIFGDRRGDYTNTSDLKRALSHFGLKPSYRTVSLRSSLVSIRSRAVIKTNLRNVGSDNEEWHWVVWDGQRIWDPKDPPYLRYRPVAYLLVDG